MSGIEFLRQAKQAALENEKKVGPPANMDESMERINEYIDSQLPVTYEMDFVPVCFDVTKSQEKILIGGRFGNIAIYNVITQKMTKDIELSSYGIVSVTLAMEDKVAIVTTESNSVYFLDFPSFYLHKTIVLSGNRICVALNLFKDCIYLVNSTLNVKVIELEKLNERNFPVEIPANCIDISDDDSLIVLGLENGSLALLHGETDAVLQNTEPCEFKIESVTISQFRRFIAAGFQDFSVKVWLLDGSLTVKCVLTEHTAPIRGLAFVNKSRYLVTGGADNKIMVLDMKVEGEPFFLELFDNPVLYFKVSPDFTQLYFSQEINKLMVWKIPHLSKNARYRKHEEKVTKIIFIPGGSELLSLSSDGLAIIWDYQNNLERDVIKIGSPLITGVISATAQFGFLSTERPSLLRLSLVTHKFYEFSMNGCPRSMRLSPDENLLVIGDDFFRVLVYDSVIMERKFVMKGHTGRITDLYFLNQNKLIITCSEDTSLVRWAIPESEKVNSLVGHTSPVKCMIITPDEEWALSGSEDNIVIIWSLKMGTMIYKIPHQESPSGIMTLYLSTDKTYLVTLQDQRLTYWQISNLCIIYQKDTSYPGAHFAFSDNGKVLAIAEGSTIYVEENQLTAESIKVVGKRYGSEHKFMNYVREIQKQSTFIRLVDSYNHWMITPYRISLAHILAYTNKYDILSAVLIETDNKASFCSTINNENPLSISVMMDHKSCVETCLKYMKIEFAAENIRAYMPLANCLTELTCLALQSIPALYDIIFQESAALYVPSFCAEGVVALPSLNWAREITIDVDALLPPDMISTHGESIVFFATICPINLELGSDGSVAFLEAISDCAYDEIFRSRLLNVLLMDKWEKIKRAIFAQGSLYILYLIQLSIHTVLLQDNKWFLILLFIVHVLLFLYEVLQIATDFIEYWFDMWNLLDQLRGLSFTIYAFLVWQGVYDRTMLLIVIIFSWTRGISYFRMFQGTRYMVRLLSEVVNDMQTFFIILFYSTLAFTFIFYVKDAELPFLIYLTVSYRLDLADFNTDSFEASDWIIFFFSTVIGPLIMMNLLISIMGTTYERVKETSDVANFQALTEMIIEIEKLMFWKKSWTRQHFIQQCVSLTSLESEVPDKINDRLKIMKKHILSIETTVNEIFDEVKQEHFEEINREIVSIRDSSLECKTLLLSNQEAMQSSNDLLAKLSSKLNLIE